MRTIQNSTISRPLIISHMYSFLCDSILPVFYRMFTVDIHFLFKFINGLYGLSTCLLMPHALGLRSENMYYHTFILSCEYPT